MRFLFAFILSASLIGAAIIAIPQQAKGSSTLVATQVPPAISSGNASGSALQRNSLSNAPANMSDATMSLLLNDTISALKSGDTNTALIHLRLVNQELTALIGNTTSTQLERLLADDAIKSIQNGDINTALAHLNLLAQDVTVHPSKNALIARSQSFTKVQTNIRNFSTYNNPILGFTIQYPHDWLVAEHTINPAANNTVVSFFSPSKSASALGNISGVSGNFVPYVDVYSFPSKNISLLRLVNETFKNLKNTTVIESRSLALKGGAPAYIVVYDIVVAGEESFKKMQLWTINAGNVYVITYTSEASLFSNYLPLAQKMLNSVAFIPGTKTPILKITKHPSGTKLKILPAAPPKGPIPPLSR